MYNILRIRQNANLQLFIQALDDIDNIMNKYNLMHISQLATEICKKFNVDVI